MGGPPLGLSSKAFAFYLTLINMLFTVIIYFNFISAGYQFLLLTWFEHYLIEKESARPLMVKVFAILKCSKKKKMIILITFSYKKSFPSQLKLKNSNK